jgi:hypothetical protein
MAASRHAPAHARQSASAGTVGRRRPQDPQGQSACWSTGVRQQVPGQQPLPSASRTPLLLTPRPSRYQGFGTHQQHTCPLPGDSTPGSQFNSRRFDQHSRCQPPAHTPASAQRVPTAVSSSTAMDAATWQLVGSATASTTRQPAAQHNTTAARQLLAAHVSFGAAPSGQVRAGAAPGAVGAAGWQVTGRHYRACIPPPCRQLPLQHACTPTPRRKQGMRLPIAEHPSGWECTFACGAHGLSTTGSEPPQLWCLLLPDGY